MLDSNRTLVQPVIHCNIINRPVQCTENGISSLWCPSQWCMCWWCLVAQSCPTLCDPIDCSPPSSSVHGILQARILEWVAMPSSRGSSEPRDWTQVSCVAGGFFTISATREVQISINHEKRSDRYHHVQTSEWKPLNEWKPLKKKSESHCTLQKGSRSWKTREGLEMATSWRRILLGKQEILLKSSLVNCIGPILISQFSSLFCGRISRFWHC